MKILFTIPTLGTGGAERVASILANKLSTKNSVKIVTLEKSKVDAYTVNENIDIIKLDNEVIRGNKILALFSFMINFFNQRKNLKKIIKNFEPDVVISFLPKADFIIYTIKNKKFKWIVSERNDPSVRNCVEKSIINKMYKKAEILVCQTQKIMQYYKKKGIKNIEIIYNPLVLDKTDIIPEKTKENIIIAVGRLDSQKNYKMLIKAFAQVKNKKNYKLYIVGSGKLEEQLKKMICDLHMNKKIELIGRTNNIFQYYEKSKIFVLSSDYEGMPNSMLEAMAFGLPIISTNFYSGVAEEFIDEKNGIITAVGNQNEMTLALEKMISKSDDELELMGIISRKKVQRLNVDLIVEEWESAINSIVEENKCRKK